MRANAMYVYDLKYRKLTDSVTSSWEIEQLIEYFVTHEAERKQVGQSSIAWAFLNLALHKNLLVSDKAIWGLVQLQAWDELGILARIWIAPQEELKRPGLLASELWLACLRDPDAIRPLGWALTKGLSKPTDTDNLWSAVRGYFRRKDEAIQRRAIIVVGNLHIAPAFPTLKTIVENPAKAALHDDAIEAIGLIGDNRAVRYLLRLLEDPVQRSIVIWALQLTRSPKAVPALKKLLASPIPPATQVEVIEALGEVGGDAAARVLLKHLDGPHRLRVIDALGTARSSIAVPRLEKLLRSRGATEAERSRAAEALSQIDTPEARRALADALAHGSKKAAGSAGAALRDRRQD